jgi:hypothetical protein
MKKSKKMLRRFRRLLSAKERLIGLLRQERDGLKQELNLLKHGGFYLDSEDPHNCTVRIITK